MTVDIFHRPIVPSPLNPNHKSVASPRKPQRKIVISRRSANLSPTQRLLRRKGSEAFNAHLITTSLAASPAPQPPRSSSPFHSQPQPLRRTSAATNSRSKNAPVHTESARALLEEELAAMTEPLASFDDEFSPDTNRDGIEDSYTLKARLVSSSAAADLLSSPLAALLHLLPLPLVSLFVLRFPSANGSYNPAVTKKDRVVEDTSFLQTAADLEECRATDVMQANSVTASLPLVLTMRRLMAAIGFLCLYALMQFEPLIRRPARSYA
ncbi:hypothetical protein BROUX41_004987 [Berkeleyomyces rouxiae]|uniref:uncharacterized protein n=1 Tax=Berkeleyomyces rouxiae TaxID=2035830 RepID=UPI003B801888